MLRTFDTVLASSDLSLDRVLNAGLPVMLVFHEVNLPVDLRQTMEELAQQNAGKVLIVTLARSDAQQAISRFGVRRFPALVTVRDNKTVASQEGLQARELKAYIAYLLGEGPKPNPRSAERPVERPVPHAPYTSHTRQTTTKNALSVNEADFEREVLRADRPVLVDFWAPWCAPCRMVEPVVEALAREQAKALKVVKVNVDENPGLASKYRAMSIPTMMVFSGGREVDRWVDALDR
jgi:thioredoxin 1